MHIHVANSGERIPRHGRERNQKRAFSPNAWDKAEELLGGAGLAEENEDISGGKGANVAMEGIERGEKRGADAERDEGLRNLVGDEGGFANASEEDGAGGGGEESAGEIKGLGEIEVLEEVVEMVLLGSEELEEVIAGDLGSAIVESFEVIGG